jgi:ABC-type branched-subunit amino acid transport system substrate-binding protein
MTRLLAALFLSLSSLLGAGEIRLAILGNIPESKSVETLAVHFAVDAANAKASLPDKLKLVGFHTKGSVEGAIEAAKKAADDSDVLGVVIHGEEGADPEVLKILQEAGLAVVVASSWSTPRQAPNAATWLSPTHLQLSEIAALYARKGRKATQVAVLDNGAPTSMASAKAFADRFRELGGKVNFEGQWQGMEGGLTRTVKALKANWPQVVFYAGEGKEAGVLVKAMRKERELKAAHLIGLPTLFDPAYIDEARMDTKLSTVIFPAPDYRGAAQLARHVGVNFPRSTPNYKAYVSYAFRKPGRWSSMVFDGAQILIDAMGKAALGDSSAPQAVSPAAQEAPQLKALTRETVLQALNAIGSYKGIRGMVRFSASREPADVKAMIFYALPKVNTREIRWYDKQYGPPFQ